MRLHRRPSRALQAVAGGAVAAVALTLGAVPSAATPGGSGGPTRRTGTRAHAGYVIEVPPDWNRELVMWAHGYRGTGSVLTVDPSTRRPVDPLAFGMRRTFVEQGYAWAASSYA